jgi:hypothetical protein
MTNLRFLGCVCNGDVEDRRRVIVTEINSITIDWG